MDKSNEKTGLNKKRIIIAIGLIVILILAYFFYTNRVIGSRWGADGQFIQIGNVSYIEANVHQHSNEEKGKYIGQVKYENGTKSKIYKFKTCKYCIFAYDGTPKIFMKK